MYKLDLTQQDIDVILTALAYQPYHMVVGVMNSITAQMTAIDKQAKEAKNEDNSKSDIQG